MLRHSVQAICCLFLVLPVHIAAQEAVSYYGFAHEKSRYYVLTEPTTPQTALGLDQALPVSLYFERKRGVSKYVEYAAMDATKCFARKDIGGKWTSVICAANDSSPLSGVEFTFSAVESRKRKGRTLNCTKMCKPDVPARIELFVPVEGE
jgi:hypothetical protein